MATSTNAYLVGMSDKAREDLVIALQETGYRLSETAQNLKILSHEGSGHNHPDLIVIDIADMTPGSADNLAETQRTMPGTKLILIGRRASETLGDGQLADGIWGLAPNTISARGLEDLMGFLVGSRRTLH